MRLHRHVLPAQLRPVLRVAIAVAAALTGAASSAAGIAALEKHARRERIEELRRAADAARMERMLERETRAALRELEEECLAGLRLPPAKQRWFDPSCSFIRSLRAAAEER